MPDASGIRPDISLGVAPAGGAAPVNPLGMMGQLSEIQNRLNQNRLFQQEFQARQAIGQIWANSPDPETAIQRTMQSPWAVFAAPQIQAYRSSMETAQRVAGLRSEQNQSALQSFGKNSAAAANDVSLLPGIADRTVASLDPLIRKDAEPLIRSAQAALMQGVDVKGDPAAALAKFQANHMALMTASGLTGDAFNQLYGTSTTRDVGGQIISGVQQPAAKGGGFMAANALPKTLAPQLTTVEPASEGGAKVPGVVQGGVFNPLTTGGGGAPAGSPANANALGISSPGKPLTGLTPEQEVIQKGSGEAVKDFRMEMNDAASQLPGQMHSLDLLQKTLTEAQAGGGADLRTTMGSWAQAAKNAGMPVTDKQVQDIGNQSLPASQTFKSVIKQVATRMLSADVHGQGKSMLPEVRAYLDSLDLATDPKAILDVLNNMKYVMTQKYNMSQAYNDFLDMKQSGDPSVKNIDESRFLSWYNKKLVDEGQMSLSPLSEKGVKGIPQATPTVTHKYIPGKGIVPVEAQ